MDTSNRRELLADNQHVRDHRHLLRKEDGLYMHMRIPEADFYALCRLYPDLCSSDPDERNAAWKRLYLSPFGEPYRIARTPTQVQRSARA